MRRQGKVMLFPLPNMKYRGITTDTNSFQNFNFTKEYELPLPPHPGAFGVQRKHHIHEGIDIYCGPDQLVVAMEGGTIINIEDFTGPKTGSPWWFDTQSVLIEGESGVILYGEISPMPYWKIGDRVLEGDLVGYVSRVLKKDKGRPRDMLHLEFHTPGTKESKEWIDLKPETLLDPTELLMRAI